MKLAEIDLFLRRTNIPQCVFDRLSADENTIFHLPEKSFIDRRIAGTRSRADQDLAFPVVSFRAIVTNGICQRHCQRPDASVRAQAKIHAVSCAFAGRIADYLRGKFGKFCEILMVRYRARVPLPDVVPSAE